MARPRSGAQLAQVTGGPSSTEGGQEAPTPAQATTGSEEAPGASGRALPALPTQRTEPSGRLDDKMVVIYGPGGIGKSTLASEWHERALFLDCEGGLGDLSVFKMPVTDWTSFRLACASLLQEHEAALAKDEDPPFPLLVIDTGDRLAKYCSQWVRQRLGIVHESDADWGKGWTLVADEMTTRIARLVATPKLGLIIVCHHKQIEIKTPTRVYDKNVLAMTGQARDAIFNMADLVLFADTELSVEGTEERRVLRTKPSQLWDAKERSAKPRLPATIEWPLGKGFEVIRTAWSGQ